jgi:hypothetical protein
MWRETKPEQKQKSHQKNETKSDGSMNLSNISAENTIAGLLMLELSPGKPLRIFFN